VAAKLMQYYQYISEQKGALGRTQLAMKTKVPSTQAAMEPDSPETIQKFKAAIKEITGGEAPSY
jgi:hypothetical protein